MHPRIEAEPDEYKRIKEIAKTDKNFKPYLRWFHGRSAGLSDHEALVKKKFIALQGEKNPDGSARLHSDIAEVAGCSKGTVGNVLNSRGQLSKSMADNILKNLHKAEQDLQT